MSAPKVHIRERLQRYRTERGSIATTSVSSQPEITSTFLATEEETARTTSVVAKNKVQLKPASSQDASSQGAYG
eukprot:m.98575 g.98575  ORF g.98575 m.98575 type:complete len:74 (-) comp16752_c0_seq4:633-854(-)